jgi:hypothetical protein
MNNNNKMLPIYAYIVGSNIAFIDQIQNSEFEEELHEDTLYSGIDYSFPGVFTVVHAGSALITKIYEN